MLKTKTLLLAISLALAAFTLTASAQTSAEEISEVISAYRKHKEVGELGILTPTVVEVPLGDEFIERFDFAVFNQTTKNFEPYYFKREAEKISFSVRADTNSAAVYRIADNNLRTYADFLLPENNQGQVQIVLSSPEEITASGLTLLLDDYVALPNSIEVRAQTLAGETIVVKDVRMRHSTVRFLRTRAKRWIINLTYGQPLRIAELRLVQDDKLLAQTNAIRFLAQPNNHYRVYLDPDRQTKPRVGEAGNLSSDEDVLPLSFTASQNNPDYLIADVDRDQVPDILDNCVTLANRDQEDINNNGRGDLCDDFDKDGLINSQDNCPNKPNRNQKDTDGDGLGDVCDEEESRITERYQWLPWLGIGFAVVVLVVLLALTVKSMKKDQLGS